MFLLSLTAVCLEWFSWLFKNMLSDDLDLGLFFKAHPCALKNAIFVMVFIVHEWFFAAPSIMWLCYCVQLSTLVPTSHILLKPFISKWMAGQDGKANVGRKNTRMCQVKTDVAESLHVKFSPGSMFLTKWGDNVQWILVIKVMLNHFM